MSSATYQENTAIINEKASQNWPVVIGLFLLLAIPGIPATLIVSSVLVGTVSNDLPLSFVNTLYLSSPWAVIVHGMAGVLFFLFTPFQFSPALRAKHVKVHRYSGYLVFVSGYLMAISGVWMHLTLSPNNLGPRYVGLVLMSFAMCIAFSLALKHIIQRDVTAHKKWVIRALAITLGAITYLFVEIAFSLTIGQFEGLKPLLSEFLHDYGRITAVLLNLVIVERWAK